LVWKIRYKIFILQHNTRQHKMAHEEGIQNRQIIKKNKWEYKSRLSKITGGFNDINI